MPVSEFVLVPLASGEQASEISSAHWNSWWDGKKPRFEQDDGVLYQWICGMTPGGGKVLEGGCGLGRWVHLLQTRGFACLGVESADGALEAASRLFPDCSIRKGDIAHLDFIPDDAIDTYLSWGVLEHFREGPGAPLAEALRVLKPGGILLATIPNYSFFRKLTRPFSLARDVLKSFRFVQRLAGKEPSRPVWFEYQYAAAEWVGHLEAAGFFPLRTIPLFQKHGVHDASWLFRKSRTTLQLNILGSFLEWMSRSFFPDCFAHMNLFVARKPFSRSESRDLNELAE